MPDLPPPPAPRPAAMPPMTEADKQRLGISAAPTPVAAPMMSSPMMSAPMMGSPMMGTPMMGGCPSVGMGPNLVFNFGHHPGMYMVAPVACADGGGDGGDKKEEKPPGPPQLVQGNPTWCRPRMPVKKGQKMKDSPCVIM